MTARISRTFSFQSGAYFKGVFFMNSYDADIHFTVESTNVREQNIALDRVNHLFDKALESTIFIDETDTEMIQKYMDADLKICTLPELPYDQVIGIMLLLKINAITDGRLTVTDIAITSKLSDGVNCHHSVEETVGPFVKEGWWNESSLKVNNLTKNTNKSKKVVKLVKSSSTWDDLFLGWEEDILPFTGSSSEIVFASFDNKTEK